MTYVAPPRVPAGVSTGGRYTARQRSEVDILLGFANPPCPRAVVATEARQRLEGTPTASRDALESAHREEVAAYLSDELAHITEVYVFRNKHAGTIDYLFYAVDSEGAVDVDPTPELLDALDAAGDRLCGDRDGLTFYAAV